jgi:hypothetical protein
LHQRLTLENLGRSSTHFMAASRLEPSERLGPAVRCRKNPSAGSNYFVLLEYLRLSGVAAIGADA